MTDNPQRKMTREGLIAQCETLRERMKELEGSLRAIAGCFTQNHANALERWKGCGTEAFEDQDFMDACALSPVIVIAKEALKEPTK